MTMDETPAATVAPVRRSVTVPLERAEAFELFTAGIHRWWPLATHSVGGAAAVRCAIEPRAGGEVREEHADGTCRPWGRVEAWEPPARLVLSWHPGRDQEQATEVEVRFSAVPEGCRVELEHRGWEVLGTDARPTRGSYDRGWQRVLELYVETASGAEGRGSVGGSGGAT